MGTSPPLAPGHLDELRRAKDLLENPGLAATVSSLVGTPIEKLLSHLPEGVSGKLADATSAALHAALRGALWTMKDTAPAQPSPWWHKAAAAVSGGAGGFFGIAGLAAELPVSTTIMCRSIADIARANGEDLSSAGARLACIEVFAYGGPGAGDDGADSGYFAVRGALAEAVRDAAVHIARKGLAAEGAPALVRLVGLVAARFNVQVTEKAAAQAVPVLGAVAGALVNVAFTDHFQRISRGHFAVRRLERLYGAEAVRLAYDGL